MTPSPTGPVPSALAALAGADQPGVLAMITRVEGPSYRPVGARMAVFADGSRVGTLSSGCIEDDITLHALKALEAGKPQTVLYGRGSPFIDIQLPCGGGLEILLLPSPDRDVLAEVRAAMAARRAVTLAVDPESGALELREVGETGWHDGQFLVRIEPEIRFLVFGKGPEATTFAGLVQAAGFPNVLLSPDDETLALAAAGGSEVRHLTGPVFPDGLDVDGRTAVVLFFHDHEWEPPILLGALATPAFYIGAQGSQRARDARLMELEAMGAGGEALARLKGPIGLVPSARDARTLAVSVLAEVLAEAGPVRS